MMGCAYCFVGGCEAIAALGLVMVAGVWLRAKWHTIKCKCACHQCECQNEEVKDERSEQ
jgi:hypothetical protein